MIALLASAPALPLGRAGKFVAAAYIVAFVIVLLYVAIMVRRARRVERDLEQLKREVQAARGKATAPGPSPDAPGERAAGAPVGRAPGAPVANAPDGAGRTVPASADTERSGSRL